MLMITLASCAGVLLFWWAGAVETDNPGWQLLSIILVFGAVSGYNHQKPVGKTAMVLGSQAVFLALACGWILLYH